MKNTKRGSVKKATTRKSTKKGAFKTRYLVSAAVIVCAIIIGVLATMGPKLGLQTAPIEPQAMKYLHEHKLLQKGEIIEAFKAISYYTYNKAAVVTNKRIFVYDNDKIHSIALDQISMVLVKNSDLGHQEVIIAAGQNGVIGLELYHTYVPKLIKLLNVSHTIVKDTTKGYAIEKMDGGKATLN